MTLSRASSSLVRLQSQGLIKKQINRHLATVSSSDPSASNSKSDSSSSKSVNSWKLPIEPGVEPAYDEAIKLINEQAAQLKEQISSLKSQVEKTPLHSPERALAEANLHATSIISQINDPEVRWKFRVDPNVSLSNPVFAHLREKTWREKSLPRLMQRSRLMRVVPDAISELTPMADVQVAFGKGEGIHDHGGGSGEVTVGCFVDANISMNEPTITVTPFHAEERLYTLALIDLDAPVPEEDRLITNALWLVHNVSLSSTKTQVNVNPEQVALSYIPPHPQRGTKYHRYGLLLLKQKDESKIISSDNNIERKGFSLSRLAETHQLQPCGLHFWRAKWSDKSSKSISKVYKDILQEKEPIFLSELA